jgi:hypothetical protein
VAPENSNGFSMFFNDHCWIDKTLHEYHFDTVVVVNDAFRLSKDSKSMIKSLMNCSLGFA